MKAADKRTTSGDRKLYLFFFVSFFCIFAITSAGDTPYNYFIRLADALLHGRLYLNEAPVWLSELVPAGNEKWFVVQPPMPALLALPFVAFFGIDFPQQILAHIVGATIAVVSMMIAKVIVKKRSVMIWTALLTGVGTIMWYESATGSVWYLGQLTAALFLLLGIYETITKKRPFLVGLALGAAYLSRVHTILSILFFIHMLRDELFSATAFKSRRFIQTINWRKNIYFALGLGVFLSLNALYNFLRFGVIWDKGYFLIPGILNEPWFSKGMLNVAYMKDHLELLFVKLPLFSQEHPYIKPSWYGLAIWITTPAFLLALLAPMKNKAVWVSWISIFLIFLILSLRGGTGWTQFGYRYAIDFHAFLIFLTLLGIKKTGLKKYYWVLLFIGIIVNLWGVVWINKFGWVQF